MEGGLEWRLEWEQACIKASDRMNREPEVIANVEEWNGLDWIPRRVWL